MVAGAPVNEILVARMARKNLLLCLMAVFFIGNTVSVFSGSYYQLIGARFLTGLPHGAFFGVASLVAASLVTPESVAGR
ncbi:MFS transporter [Citrobacter gillenii]|uniref:MFS transporter n=1 Tax=Citrobacter sp. C1 TaxID=2769343 RepID=UPI001FC91442|nr:MFS transporter [Citrobacter gillenii]